MRIQNFNRVVISGLVFMFISEIINTVSSILTMSYYTNPLYFSLWSKLMMPANGPPGSEFYLASIAIGIVIGIIFAATYSLLKESIPGKGISKGINYGILLFLVAGVPFTLTTYLVLAIPAMLLIYWALSELVIYLICGAVFAKIMENE